MIDPFVIQELIDNNMVKGTITISFDKDMINVSTNYREKQYNATDKIIAEDYEIRRHQKLAYGDPDSIIKESTD